MDDTKNKSALAQKKQEAFALRQKLEQWREEKKKKLQEQTVSKKMSFNSSVQRETAVVSANTVKPVAGNVKGTAKIQVKTDPKKPAVKTATGVSAAKPPPAAAKPAAARSTAKSASVAAKPVAVTTLSCQERPPRNSLTGQFRRQKAATGTPRQPLKKTSAVKTSSAVSAMGVSGSFNSSVKKTAKSTTGVPAAKNKTATAATSARRIPATKTSAVGSPGRRINGVKKAGISRAPKGILKQRNAGVSLSSSAAGASSSFALPDILTPRRVPVKEKPMTTPGRVKFSTPASVGSGQHSTTKYRKTPASSRAQEYMNLDRWKLNEWLAAKGRTPSGLRHSSCFGCDADACRQLQAELTPRITSMSVEQLARQENALTKEDKEPAFSSFSFSSSPAPRRTSTPRRLTMVVTPLPQNPIASKEVVSSDNIVEDSNIEVFREETADYQESVQAETEETADYQESVQEVSHARRQAPSGSSRFAQLESDFVKCEESLESQTISPEDALEWTGQVGEACPEVKQLAGWYKVQVSALKILSDLVAIPSVFEQAIVNNAQPAEEIAQMVSSFTSDLLPKLKGRRTRRSTAQTPASCRRVRSEHAYAEQLDKENIFKSTTVRYSVTEVTPFKKRRYHTCDDIRDCESVPVITPVRRSTRFSTSRASSAVKSSAVKNTPCAALEFSAIEDVPSAEKERMLFQPNQALEPLLGEGSPNLVVALFQDEVDLENE